ncbi:hypothetical protein [Nonlabens sp. Asnod3-A02]
MSKQKPMSKAAVARIKRSTVKTSSSGSVPKGSFAARAERAVARNIDK